MSRLSWRHRRKQALCHYVLNGGPTVPGALNTDSHAGSRTEPFCFAACNIVALSFVFDNYYLAIG